MFRARNVLFWKNGLEINYLRKRCSFVTWSDGFLFNNLMVHFKTLIIATTITRHGGLPNICAALESWRAV